MPKQLKRKSGYYWVKFLGHSEPLQIAHYLERDNGFILFGVDKELLFWENEFSYISPTPIKEPK